MQESIPVGAAEARPHDPSSTSVPAHHGGPLADPRALQILSTEHWSLLTGRALAYNEAFSRAGMFLSFLSASLIVIGFLIGAQGMSSAIVPVAALLLVADLFIGAATAGRLFSASREELQAIRGMNRIRHAYREMVPGIEPYFVTSFNDDALGVLATYGEVATGHSILESIGHGLTTTIGMVATIDAMILGALAALAAIGVGAPPEVALVAGLIGFAVGFVAFAVIGMRLAVRGEANAEARFPTPSDEGS